MHLVEDLVNALHSAAISLFLIALSFNVLSYTLLQTSVAFPSTYTSPSQQQPSTSCRASGQCSVGLTESIWNIGITITTPNAFLWQASGFLEMVADFLDCLALIVLPPLLLIGSPSALVQWLTKVPIPIRKDY